ncbi:hypothetical protein [Nonomuraea sp. NPDC049504]|uniref:hypothetical protein n=1 Tax=Nonomuraea sp. NPDC049504 TaxID=3154729 RepID=UPI003444C2E1
MDEQVVAQPNGCRYCGLPQRGSRTQFPHGSRWTSSTGWHVWTPPTQDQIKQRMKARRTWRGQSASLVIIDEAMNWPVPERTDMPVSTRSGKVIVRGGFGSSGSGSKSGGG